MFPSLEVMGLNTFAFMGLFACIGGLVFYFTSGAFSILDASLGAIFQGFGMILVYMGVAFIMWAILSSIDVFFESFGRRG